jgi:CheY-like chemotaxis protein
LHTEEVPVPTVLVVDDSPLDRRLAGSVLEKHCGCALLYAEDGADALRQVARQLPDLVLTDLQMPEMDGLQLTAALKSDYPLVPVVLMTAQGSEEIAAQALRRGAASYVPKRKLVEDLAPTVLRILLGAQEDRAHSQLMHHLETSHSTFVLDNDPGLIQALVHHLQEMLRCLPLADETERLRVGVALEEALMNACYHGNLEVGEALGQADRRAYEELAERRRREAPYRDRRIHLSARLSRQEAVFVIRDEGPGFDIGHLPAADVATAERGAGRGVTLMRTIMDAVVYNGAGNEVTLLKRRAPDPAPEEGAEGAAG